MYLYRFFATGRVRTSFFTRLDGKKSMLDETILQGLQLSDMAGLVISLAMVTIGTSFIIGFSVKKVLQFLKSF